MKLTREQKRLRHRILEISYKNKFSHLGSCLSAVDLINAIYKVKKPNEKFVLSNGHAAVAWYAILEKEGLLKPSITETLHVHPERNEKYGITASTGSLGHGLPIALGMALADRKKRVYCMISDGETMEGSIWETLRIADALRVHNLIVVVNYNGFGAYMEISKKPLIKKLKGFGYSVVEVDGHNETKLKKALKSGRTEGPEQSRRMVFAQTTVNQLPFLVGQDAHYKVMNEEEYKEALEALK